MDNKQTSVVYETFMDCSYDLLNNPGQREAMLGKAARMAVKFGSVMVFRDRLLQDIESMRFVLNQKVVKWYTLQKQVEFLDRVLAGEISLPTESELGNGSSGPEAA
jgi:hypothetical protein